jgi:hypothetical protein
VLTVVGQDTLPNNRSRAFECHTHVTIGAVRYIRELNLERRLQQSHTLINLMVVAFSLEMEATTGQSELTEQVIRVMFYVVNEHNAARGWETNDLGVTGITCKGLASTVRNMVEYVHSERLVDMW